MILPNHGSSVQRSDPTTDVVTDDEVEFFAAKSGPKPVVGPNASFITRHLSLPPRPDSILRGAELESGPEEQNDPGNFLLYLCLYLSWSARRTYCP